MDAALKEAQDGDGTRSLGRFRLQPGNLVAFTGQMNGTREQWEARATDTGLKVASLTRRTRLLVAADPDSLSGKAKKAREYGIPIVTEEAFAKLLDRLERLPR